MKKPEDIADEITRFAFAIDGPYKVNIDPHKDLLRFSETFERIRDAIYLERMQCEIWRGEAMDLKKEVNRLTDAPETMMGD